MTSNKMPKLTQEQKQFLQNYGVPLSRVFDATGLSRAAYQAAMQSLELQIAFGVAPCKESGHTLRVRSGHCVQCEPKNLAFLRRFEEDGEVYILKSSRMKLIKVGSSKDPIRRLKALNGYSYGGSSDWELWVSYKTTNAGKVEFETHKALRQKCISNMYYYDGREIQCSELFRCGVAVAHRALRHAMKASTQ